MSGGVAGSVIEPTNLRQYLAALNANDTNDVRASD
jgi:hypothetical protein